MRLWLAAACLWPAAAWAQGAVVTFTFDNPALQPPHYVITVPEQGPGRYEGAADSRALTIPDAQKARLFALARKNKLFATPCANSHGNLAFTGNKTFAFQGPEGGGSCTFNYAKDAKLGQAADELIAVATTLEEGRKLEVLLAHDKLGLNAEVDILSEEQSSGRALALGNIAPVLQRIAADPDVLNHTRSSVEALLKH